MQMNYIILFFYFLQRYFLFLDIEQNYVWRHLTEFTVNFWPKIHKQYKEKNWQKNFGQQ